MNISIVFFRGHKIVLQISLSVRNSPLLWVLFDRLSYYLHIKITYWNVNLKWFMAVLSTVIESLNYISQIVSVSTWIKHTWTLKGVILFKKNIFKTIFKCFNYYVILKIILAATFNTGKNWGNWVIFKVYK